MFLKLYDTKGKESGKVRVKSEVFGLEPKAELIRQVALSQSSNRRINVAHTKDRGEVRGGGKKPHRQKGTGRARAGSNRSPIWKGGGVTFGPLKNRNFKKVIPKKLRRKALLQTLSAKAKEDLVIVLDSLSFKEPKTKNASEIVKNLSLDKKKFLLSLPEMDRNLIMSFNNIPNGKVIQAKDLNVLDLLSSKYLMLTKNSIKVIEDTFLNKEETSKKKEE